MGKVSFVTCHNNNEGASYPTCAMSEEDDPLLAHIKQLEEDEIPKKECPKCEDSAVGAKEIERVFGFRVSSNGKKIPQSYCKGCR